MSIGKRLIELGYEPGKWFSKAIEEISRVENPSDAQIRMIAESLLPKTIKLRKEPAPLHVNITAENEMEAENMNAAIATMTDLLRTPVLTEGSIMPDACPAGPMDTIPVGGVVTARNAILPGTHSADICCSVQASIISGASPAETLDAVHKVTHFGGGARPEGAWRKMPEDLIERFRSNPFLSDDAMVAWGHSFLGTQGDGNHFAYVGILESTGETVLVTHHGSRKPGAILYKRGMQVAENHRREISPETRPQNAWIPSDTQDGRDYWEALQIIRDWTKLNHDIIHDECLRLLGGARLVHRRWNEHNFVFREETEDGTMYHHGKGATPVHSDYLPDTDGVQIIPLNMAQPVLFVQGARKKNNLGFAPHGAGRNMSRTKHVRMMSGESIKSILARETAGLDIRFFSGRPDISELPSAYKDANRVQADIERFDLARIVDRVLPYGCIMAGDWQADAPWRRKK